MNMPQLLNSTSLVLIYKGGKAANTAWPIIAESINHKSYRVVPSSSMILLYTVESPITDSLTYGFSPYNGTNH